MRAGAMPELREAMVRTLRIRRISRVVSDLARAESFYRSALGFRTVARAPLDLDVLEALGIPEVGARELRMRLGKEEIALVQFDRAGRPYPRGSRSSDLWFQHLAIVASDMDAAYDRLCRHPGWRPISRQGPQLLPPSSGGVRAFKFRDPDGHPLELLWLPQGRGIGIDHSALAVSSTRASLGFYRSLGLHVRTRSLNHGAAQSRLDALRAARVRVTALRAASTAGPGVELLAYRPPGRSRRSSVLDLSTDWMTLEAVARGPGRLRKPRLLRDPDGHRLLIMGQGRGSAGPPA